MKSIPKKPKFKSVRVFNLNDCLDYLEDIGFVGIKNSLMADFWHQIEGNADGRFIHFGLMKESRAEYRSNPELRRDIGYRMILEKVFNIRPSEMVVFQIG